MEDNLFLASSPVRSMENMADKKEFNTNTICLISVPEKGSNIFFAGRSLDAFTISKSADFKLPELKYIPLI